MNRLLAIAIVLTFPLVASAQQAPPAKIVQVAAVQRAEIAPTIAVPGTVYSRNDVQITAGISGQLINVAEPGTVVEKGALVASMDLAALRLQRAEQAALRARANIEIEKIASDFRRQKELSATNVVSEFQLEQTAADLELARSDQRIIGIRIQQIDEQISRGRSLAPFPGVIVERRHRAGEDVTRGDVLARLVDTETREVRAFVPLKHLQRTAVGDALEIFTGDLRADGNIRALIPSVDVRSQTFEARIDLDTVAARYWSVGELVSVAIPIRARSSSLAVPRDALVLRNNGSFVFRINAENKAERVRVELGDSHGNLIGVTGLLEVGDHVAVRGAETLTDGADVQVQEGQKAS